MSRLEHRVDEPDDATTELPKVPEGGLGEDPLDPASLAWSSAGEPPAGDGDRPPARPPTHGAAPSELSDVSFPTAWRGYEPTAVDAYVRQVTRTIADLEGSRSPAEAVRRALDRVGEETSSILQEAEQTAERMTEKSRRKSSERLEQAEREADEITLAARTRLRQLDADVDRIWLERQRLIDDTRRLSERLVQIADQAEERFPAEDDDTTMSDDTTVGDSVRASRISGGGHGETVRFAPPGMLDLDTRSAGEAEPLHEAREASSGADGGDSSASAGAPGGLGEDQPAPAEHSQAEGAAGTRLWSPPVDAFELGGGGGPNPSDAHAATSTPPDPEGHAAELPLAGAPEGAVSADSETSGAEEGESVISWSTPEADSPAATGDEAHEDHHVHRERAD